MARVAGCDPGTSSLDLLILDDGLVAEQIRFEPEQIRADPVLPVEWLRERGPFDLIAGPSGYGLPLVRAEQCTDADLERMALVRPDECGQAKGVGGFTLMAKAFRDSGLPVVFLPGVIHLSTVPAYRKWNKIDLGTPDKLCVAALAAAEVHDATVPHSCSVLEIGSAFTAVVMLNECGEVVDGLGGTSGPLGWQSGGAWDGEAAYLLGPLQKQDLFRGGAREMAGGAESWTALLESAVKALAGMWAVHGCRHGYVSGRFHDDNPSIAATLAVRLGGPVESLPSLPGAWVKQAAQGAALIADGLMGGRFKPVVERMRLRDAAGTVLDGLTHPRAGVVRAWFSTVPP